MQLLNVDRAWFTVRSLPSSAVAVVVLASVPVVATVALGGSDLTGAVLAATLLGGSLAGFAADDPAVPLLEASPTTLLARRLHHLVALLAYVAVLGVVVAFVSVAHDGPPISLLERAREAIAAGGLAVAAAAWLVRRTGERRPGSFGLIAGLLGPLFVSALAYRVHGLPSLGIAQDGSRWWWVAGVGWTAALWWSRDPAAR